MTRPQDSGHPRVLVAAHNPFTRRHNNSLTLTSLFEGWPAEALAQIYVPFATPVPPMFDVCRRFWALTPLGLRPVTAEPAAAEPAPPPAPPRQGPPPLARRALYRVSEYPAVKQLGYPVREYVYSRPWLLRGPAYDQVRAFAPDVVFTSLGSLCMLRLAERLTADLGATVVPFITDDWPTTEYRDVAGGRYLRREMERALRRVLDAAPVRMVISDAMAEAYRERYGGEFLPFTRCLEADRFPTAPRVRRAGEPLELVYAGQLGLGRADYLRAIGEQLLALRAEGIEARLTVHTIPAHVDRFRRLLTLDPVLRLGGHVENDALPGVYAAADVLVHVENFDAELARYTALSLSTKVSEYLMAGRAVLGYGPASLGSMRHLAASGGGVVVGEQDPAALREALRALLTDEAGRERLAAQGRAFALARHEARGQRARFLDAIRRAAERRPRARAAA